MAVDRDRILVVGGSSGIGEAAVARFVASGADVTIADVKDPCSSDATFVHCDLSDSASIAEALTNLTGQWDAVLHVAGIPGTAPAEKVVAVNFLGLRQLVTAIAPQVTRGGSIVVVASTAGASWPARMAELSGLLSTTTFEQGRDWYAADRDEYPAYNVSKEATLAFVTKFSATAWREYGIRVNAVSPGPTQTPILGDFEQTMGENVLHGVRALVGRYGTVEDVVPVIAFLTTPEAGWIIGQDIQVDGGFVAAMSTGAYDITQLTGESA